jgi:type I restriction enzyme S subunit
MSETLRNLSTIEYGASPKVIRANDSTPIGIYGTGGLVGSATKALFHGPLVVVARKGTLDNPLFINGDCWVIDTAYAVLPNANVDAKWLYYNLLMFDLKKLNESTGVPSISRDYLYRVVFEIFPLPEQRKIARILSTVDAVIEKTEAAIAKYKAIKSGMMRDLFTRGIDLKTGKLRPRYEDAPELYKESELGWIPREWEVKNADEIVEVIDPQPDHRTPPTVTIGFPYIGIADTNANGEIDFDSARKVSKVALDKQIASFNIYDGAIIFGKIGTIGQPTKIPKERFFTLSANIVLFTSVNIESIEYLYYWLKSASIAKQILNLTNTTSQPALGIEKMRKFQLCLPKSDEKNEIVKKLTNIDKLITSDSGALLKYIALKSALMSDLLTGKVRVKYNENEKVEAAI